MGDLVTRLRAGVENVPAYIPPPTAAAPIGFCQPAPPAIIVRTETLTLRPQIDVRRLLTEAADEITALRQQLKAGTQAEHSRWKLVPVESSVEMITAFHGAVEASILGDPPGYYQDGSAAPAPPSPWMVIDENAPTTGDDVFLWSATWAGPVTWQLRPGELDNWTDPPTHWAHTSILPLPSSPVQGGATPCSA